MRSALGFVGTCSWMLCVLALAPACSGSKALPSGDGSVDGADGGGNGGGVGDGGASSGDGGSGSGTTAGTGTGTTAGTGGATAGTTAGTGGTTGGTGSPDSAAAEVSAKLADAICDAEEACVGEFRMLTFNGGEPCRPDLEARLADTTFVGLGESIRAGYVDYDPSKLDACAADVRALGCDVRPSRLPQSCHDALTGNVTVGNACHTDMDCLGNTYCDQTASATCPGVCTQRAEEDEACTSDESCRTGLICENAVENDKWICTPPRGAEERCPGQYSPLCELGTECFVKDGVNLYHVCKPIEEIYAGQEGDSCVSSWGQLCQDDPSLGTPLSCQEVIGTVRSCQPAVTADADCGLGRSDPCPMAQYCNTESGKCEDRVGNAQPCNPARPRYCAEGHACLAANLSGQTAAYCLKLGKIGESCIVSGQCFSGYCSQGTCAAKLDCQ